ncbi:hypothetical protein EIN_198110 [Entamoeba invadens IP1]|uniref:TLDc domain-containing protein n=1 Tax=Entamoeba invadens IP1 TaxID=370355 RepID=A0A0A1TWZ7_ENTIV|nr:hypothetical protein EIN_198110 [Entamoeba invadens IP1]ELP83858.1 hypothetical protein EIN_198110 [Entamoeba invadens IP1]|eukprot:XP_004183204.1 hypothetical protein EIN_198110 [Entamoeba invadens IP1]
MGNKECNTVKAIKQCGRLEELNDTVRVSTILQYEEDEDKDEKMSHSSYILSPTPFDDKVISKSTGYPLRPRSANSARSSPAISKIKSVSPHKFMSRSPNPFHSSKTNSPRPKAHKINFDTVPLILQQAETMFSGLTPSVVFNSSVDGWESRELNSKIEGLDKLMFVIKMSEGWQFGFYSEDIAPVHNHSENTQVSSSNMFLFTTDSCGNKFTVINRKNKTERSFTLHTNTEREFLLTCYSAFWLTSSRKVYLHQLFKTTYQVNGLPNDNLLSIKQTGSTCQSLTVLHWA